MLHATVNKMGRVSFWQHSCILYSRCLFSKVKRSCSPPEPTRWKALPIAPDNVKLTPYFSVPESIEVNKMVWAVNKIVPGVNKIIGGDYHKAFPIISREGAPGTYSLSSEGIASGKEKYYNRYFENEQFLFWCILLTTANLLTNSCVGLSRHYLTNNFGVP